MACRKFLRYDDDIWCSICLFCTFVIFATSVFIAGFLWLQPKINELTKTTCYVSSCNCTNSTCSYNYEGVLYYYSCSECKYTYFTFADNTVIANRETTETTDKDYCDDYPIGKEFYCYYHTKDVYLGPSLTDSRNYDLPIAYIVIFSIISCILFVAFIIFSIYTYIHWKNNT